MGFDPVSYLMGKASGGGGGGEVKTFSEEWDFTSATPMVGKKLGITITSYRVTFDSNGAAYSRDTAYIRYGNMENFSDLFHDMKYQSKTIEVKVKSMELTSGTHRRFIMGSSTTGLIYRETGEWGLYLGSSGSWEMFGNTDGDLFDDSIVKMIIYPGTKTEIYKNGTLLWEVNKGLGTGDGMIGSSASSINNAVIEWLKISAIME